MVIRLKFDLKGTKARYVITTKLQAYYQELQK